MIAIEYRIDRSTESAGKVSCIPDFIPANEHRDRGVYRKFVTSRGEIPQSKWPFYANALSASAERHPQFSSATRSLLDARPRPTSVARARRKPAFTGIHPEFLRPPSFVSRNVNTQRAPIFHCPPPRSRTIAFKTDNASELFRRLPPKLV